LPEPPIPNPKQKAFQADNESEIWGFILTIGVTMA